jgi:DMSO reductase family type II enzyme molybdopterin subunit
MGATGDTRNAQQRWSWDQVTWGSHCGNCIANCTYRVYARDGEIVYQEQSGGIPGFEGVPDMNPLGCQKGGAWHTQAAGGERLLHPLRRVGERGSGQWEEIAWDEALDMLADAVIDALEDQGPESLLIDPGPESGLVGGMGRARFCSAVGGLSMDSNSTVSDVHLGHWATFGSLLGGSSADDTFRADTILVWNGNPAYTRIPYFHYLTEARYHGANVVLIAPDFSPSAPHVDMHVALRPGSDSALMLSMCGVVLDEGLVDADFVRSQTDLPFLVRTEDGRYLREADMLADGRADRFYVHRGGAVTMADPGKLDDPRGPSDVELDGTWTVTLADGTEAEVTTAFSLLRRRLADYTPEAAGKICEVHPDTIRRLARMVAGGRTKVQNGLGSCKHHHGDLMERSMDLLLALTGNWGSAGRGLDTYIIALMEGEILGILKGSAGIDAAESTIQALDMFLDAMNASDPGMTDGKAVTEMMHSGAATMSATPPAFFFWYHCGYDKIWERDGWADAPRPFGEIVKEAQSKGWWSGLVRPRPQITPKVLLQAGTNVLRRTRGGQRELLANLWPKLDMIAVLDWKMSTVGLYADLVLPVACEHERVDFHAANSHAWERMFADKAVEPRGESRSDWRIFQGLGQAVARRAAARGLSTFDDGHGGTRSYAEVPGVMSMNGALDSEEDALDELLRDCVLSGNLPPGTSVASLREKGWVRPDQLPRIVEGVTGGELRPDEPFVAMSRHVQQGVPYATLTGRAQFYIDHPWFLEAGEQLPCHKEPPPAGGDHPLQITGGHPRWSIHASNSSSQMMLDTTRGGPTVHVNDLDAAARNIADGQMIRVFNDVGSLRAPARVTPAVRPGQVILYAAWEQYLFPEWKDVTWVEPGMVKWLNFAAGYGHLVYSDLQWQPQQSDRLYRVEVEPAS